MHVLRASPIEITKKYTPQNWFLKFNLIINNIIISVATGVDVLVVYEMFFLGDFTHLKIYQSTLAITKMLITHKGMLYCILGGKKESTMMIR